MLNLLKLGRQWTECSLLNFFHNQYDYTWNIYGESIHCVFKVCFSMSFLKAVSKRIWSEQIVKSSN